MKLMQAVLLIGLVAQVIPTQAMWPFSWVLGGTEQEQKEIQPQDITPPLQLVKSRLFDQKSLGYISVCGPSDHNYALTTHPNNPKISSFIVITNAPYVRFGSGNNDQTITMKSAQVWYQLLKFNKSGSLLAFKDDSRSIWGGKVKIYHPKTKKMTELPNIIAHNAEWSADNLMAANDMRDTQVGVYKIDEKKLIDESNYIPQKLYTIKDCTFFWASFNPQGNILATQQGDDVILHSSIDGKEFARAKTKQGLETFEWNKDGTLAVGLAGDNNNNEIFLVNPQGGVSSIKLSKNEDYRLGKLQGNFLPMRTFMHEREDNMPRKVKIYNVLKKEFTAQLEGRDGAYSVEVNPEGTKFGVGKFQALELYDITGNLLARHRLHGIVRTLCWNCDGSLLYALVLGNTPGVISYAVKDDQLICVNQMQMDLKKNTQKEEIIK